MQRVAKGLLVASLMVGACGPTGESTATPDGGTEVLPIDFLDPTLDQVAPKSMALGDRVQVFGSNFLPNQYGTTYLHLVGTYQDEEGQSHSYEGDIELDVKNGSVASFEFDELYFIPTRDLIGVFDGRASLVAELAEEYRRDDVDWRKSSSEMNVSLTVEPSIGINQLRSVSNDGCAPVTDSTIGGQELGMTFAALGLGTASVEEPIHFSVRFYAPQLSVTYVKDAPYPFWPITDFEPEFAKIIENGSSTFTTDIATGYELLLDPSFDERKVQVSPPVEMGGSTYSSVLLGRLASGPTNGDNQMITIEVEAWKDGGDRVTRSINYEVREEWDVQEYDQNIRLMERTDPVPVSGCVPGGDIGVDLSYSEGSSETKSRSLSFRWDRNVAESFGFSGGIGGLLPVQAMLTASTTFSETFGVDINESVSSETHVGLNLSKRIIPGFFGTCYRQVDRLERKVDIVYNNACGRSGVMGQTVLTDWRFGFDIASGPTCEHPSDLEDGANYEPEGRPYNDQ